MNTSDFYKEIIQITKDEMGFRNREEIECFHDKIKEAASRGETQAIFFDTPITTKTFDFLQSEGFIISVSYDCPNKDDNVITIKWNIKE